MDELNHQHRSRRRRLNLAGGAATLIAILITAFSQAAPSTPKPTAPPASSTTSPTTPEATTNPSGVSQVLGQAKAAVLGAQPGLWHVTRAVDGDTLNVELGGQKETVRLLGIDTPETHDPRKPVQCFGEVAAARKKALVEGKNVRLEPDPINSDRDKYHRLLRYVYLPDGTLINAALVRDGYAFAYTVFPLTKLDEFQALETDARTANRGLWSGCNIDESQKIKQTTSAK